MHSYTASSDEVGLRPSYSVRLFYHVDLVRKIWIALRTERQKFGHGREMFASFVDETISSHQTRYSFSFPDGSSYTPPLGAYRQRL
jgi:hypothetical protein